MLSRNRCTAAAVFLAASLAADTARAQFTDEAAGTPVAPAPAATAAPGPAPPPASTPVSAPAVETVATPASATAIPVAATPARPTPRAREPWVTVTWQPVSLVWGSIDLEVEFALGRYVSTFVAPSVLPGMAQDLNGNRYPFVAGATLDAGVRVFPFGAAPGGFFVSAQGGVLGTAVHQGSRDRGLGAHFGGMIGYTFVILRTAVISLGAGAEVIHFRRIDSATGRTFGLPLVRIALGFAF